MVQTAYEQEQELLRQEHEGKIQVQAPKEPEVNPEVYKDVEPLLFRGFLTLRAEIGGIWFVLKSLNHHEFELLRFSGGYTASETPPDEFWHQFLAYGVFMVNGANVLADRSRWIPEIASTFGEIPSKAQLKLIRHLSEVNRRAANAVVLTEAYAQEVYSRYRWAQLKEMDLTRPGVTGIEGTQHLGMNWAQQVWRALNYYDDRNDQHERDWENAKFVGSCMAGKGISKVYSQDSTRREKDRDERLARKDRILREILLGEKTEDAQQGQGAVMIAPRSVDELAKQLEKDLRGEKDWHDQVIEQQERRVRENVEAREEQLQQFAADHEREFGDKRILSITDMEGLSPDEVRHRIDHSKQIHAQTLARRMVHPRTDPREVRDFLDKWGVAGPEENAVVSSTDRDPSEAVTVLPRTRPTGVPFKKK